MKHSFIAPRQKKIISAELKWILTAFVLIFALMSSGLIFLNHAIESSEKALAGSEAKRQKVENEQRSVAAETARLQKLDRLREKISTKNRLKKENVKNFFDLVPGDVTLELAEFRDNTLRLKGITKSRQRFNETFQLSLESLFSRSTTTFTGPEDGSCRFNNISVMEAKQ